MDPSWKPRFSADAYTWETFESESDLQDRMAALVEELDEMYPGETVLW